MNTKRTQTTCPVKFAHLGDARYAIWDRGGQAGERLAGFREVGAIYRGETGWTLEADGIPTTYGLPSIVAAKSLYLRSRPQPLDPALYIPQSDPDPPLTLVSVPMTMWEAADDWRARVFRAMVRRNNPAAISIMFTPLEINTQERTYLLRLPTMVAADLEEWMRRTG